MSGRLPEMSVHVWPPFRGLEDVADAAAGDEPPGVPVEDRVGVGRVGRVDGDAGDVPVRQAGRVHLVPGAAVVGGDARGECRAGVSAASDPRGVDDLPLPADDSAVTALPAPVS